MREIFIFCLIFFFVIASLVYALVHKEILYNKIKKEAQKRGHTAIEIRNTDETITIQDKTNNPFINFLKNNVLINNGLSVYQKISKKVICSSNDFEKEEFVVVVETYFSYPVKVHFKKV